MNTIKKTVQSAPALMKASIAAATIALVALVLGVLPAEYSIDQTGIGKALQLTSIAQAATTSNNIKGTLTTPFAGSYGWYWKNTAGTPVIVTLSTKGHYVIKP